MGKAQYKNEMTEKFDDMLLSKVRNEECYDSYDDYNTYVESFETNDFSEQFRFYPGKTGKIPRLHCLHAHPGSAAEDCNRL